MFRTSLKKLGIKKSECINFVPSKESDECQCGLTLKEHIENVSISSNKTLWQRDECTECVEKSQLTDAYGDIRFVDKNDQISKYIRIHYKTEIDEIIKLLFDKCYWRMKHPKLLISVTGGAQVAVSELVRDTLCRGLVKAASSTEGWITTGGTNTGIMKHVGETVRLSRSKVTLLGIASWTATSRHEDLKISSNEQQLPVVYRMKDEKLRFSKSQYLEPNHTHFILVDDSKYNNFGAEIEFRAKFEAEISKKMKIPTILVVVEGGPNTAKTVLQSLRESIPCVIIDNSGKMSDLLSYIYRKLKKESLDFSKDDKTKFKFDQRFRVLIGKKLEGYFEGRNKDIEKIIDQIEEIFDPSNRQLINVFDLNPTKQDSDLDEAILNAFSKTYSKPKKAELSIFIDGKLVDKNLLNIGDKAQNTEIFQELDRKKIVLSWNGILDGNEKDDQLLIEAFKKKKHLIVLDKTCSLCYILKQLEITEQKNIDESLKKDINRILSIDNKESVSILELDKEVSKLENRDKIQKSEYILNKFLKANPKHKIAELCLSWNRCDIARQALFNDEIPDNMDMYQDLMFNALLNDQYEFVNLLLENGFSIKKFLTYNRYKKLFIRKFNSISLITKLFRKLFNKDTNSDFDSIDLKLVGCCIEKLVDNLFEHEFSSQSNFKDLGIEKLNNPEYHLFIFNLLLGREQLSEIFWKIGENQISNALVASKILYSMSSLLEENYDELHYIANKYEQHAYDALTISNRLNEKKSIYLLVRQINHFSDITVFQIANSIRCLKFMSHPVCQKFLDKIWYHKIYPETPSYGIYISMLFPPVAPVLIHFGENQLAVKKNNNDQTYIKKITRDQTENKLKKERHIRPIESLSRKKQDSDNLDKNASILRKFLNFFLTIRDFLKAPFVKFIYDQFWFLIFLILFSYVLISDFYPVTAAGQKATRLTGSLTILELILIIWVFSFFCEEIRQFYLNEHQVMRAKIKSFFFDIKNVLEICGIFFFFVGMVLRFIPNYACYQSARIILCADIIFWYIRSLFMYSFIKKMGPMLVMIQILTRNLTFLFLIILVFIFAFGISMQSLLHPNKKISSRLLKNIFYPSFFVLVGEYGEHTGDFLLSMVNAKENCGINDDDDDDEDDDEFCPEDYVGSQVSLAIYVLYILLMNILLQNILIALVNKTYDKIQDESEPIWKYSRYSLVYEYFHKSLIPPPFVLADYGIIIIKMFLGWILNFLNHETVSNNFFLNLIQKLSRIYYPGFYLKKNKTIQESLVKWERFIIGEMGYEHQKEKNEQKEFKIKQNLEKVQILMNKYNLIAQSQNNSEKLFGLISEKLAQLFQKKNGKNVSNEKNDNRKKSVPKSQPKNGLEPKKIPQEEESPEPMINSKSIKERETPVFVEIISPVKNKTNSPTNSEKSTVSFSDVFENENHYLQLETESDLDKF